MVRRLMVIVMLAATLIQVGPASAYPRAGACVVRGEWTFSPPLTETFQSGTIAIVNRYVCTEVGVTTDPISVPNEVRSDVSGASLQYEGNCHSAVLHEGGFSMLLIEGSLGVGAYGSTGRSTAVTVLEPNETCNESSATGPWVSGGAATN